MIDLSKVVSSKMNWLELSNSPVFIVTDKLQKQIDWLHSTIGPKEWSGELITREEGNISDLDNWKIYGEEIFLVDVGTHTFTGYETEKGGFKAADITQMYDMYPGLLDGTLKNQHIHSHNNFGTFFSGTDNENLEDRAKESNYFLMLIVNFKNEHIAKVASVIKQKVTGDTIINFKNNNDGYGSIKLNNKKKDEQDMLMVMTCKVEWETQKVDTEFVNRYNHIVTEIAKEAKEAEEKKKKSNPSVFGSFKQKTSSLFNDSGIPKSDFSFIEILNVFENTFNRSFLTRKDLKSFFDTINSQPYTEKSNKAKEFGYELENNFYKLYKQAIPEDYIDFLKQAETLVASFGKNVFASMLVDEIKQELKAVNIKSNNFSNDMPSLFDWQ